MSAAGKVTAEEYLASEFDAEFRNEYCDGYVYAMSGGTWEHAIIVANLTAELGNALKPRPCIVVAHDLRLEASPATMYIYPDLMVICGAPRFVEGRDDKVTNPILIAEVLSPLTERVDRGFKAARYRTIESLREYAIVSQDEPRIEIYRRRDGQWWLKDIVGLESICHFESIDVTTPLSEIYDRITFEAPAGPPRE